MRLIARITFPFLCCALALAPRSAEALPPDIEKTVAEAVAFLEEEIPKRPASGEAVLGALALVKAGQPLKNPAVKAVVKEIKKRCSGKKYKPTGHHFYVAGLEIMLLETIDPARYRPEMKKILAYILAGQLKTGAWYYPNQKGAGDTSITQYAVLGMWSAERSGLDVPDSVWDELAVWHLKTQLKNGAFAYHPGEPAHSGPAPALTIGGAANLFLAHRYLFGEMAEKQAQGKAKSDEAAGPVYGVLKDVDLDSADKKKEKNEEAGPIRSTSPLVKQSITRAVHRAALSFRLPPPVYYKMYYLYALERMAALGGIQMLGPHNWYKKGARHLIKTQKSNGTWKFPGYSNPTVSAAFGILFLVRSTAQMLGHVAGVAELGAGLLAGGRGLPSDLSKVNVSDGQVESVKEQSPLGELLARLESAQVGAVPEVQNAIIDSVRFGDRKQLLSQRDRIRKLVDHPRGEVRRTAFWVLGRAGNLSDVPALITGLSDPVARVAIEARNALCVLARRPLGFGLPADPFAELDADASEKARKQALAEWSRKATERWKDWYAKVAPYEAHGGLGLFSPNEPSPTGRTSSP